MRVIKGILGVYTVAKGLVGLVFRVQAVGGPGAFKVLAKFRV